MPALKNQRYEAFALELFKGLAKGGGYVSHSAAYTAAGYTRNKRSAKVQACRLLQSCPAIIERVRELQAELAKARKVTVETIVDELETARVMAEKNERESAMVAASLAKAKILGLEPPAKSEVGGPGEFDMASAQSVDDVVRGYLAKQIDLPPDSITADMIEQGRQELRRHSSVLNAIAAQSAKVQKTGSGIVLTQPNRNRTAPQRH